MEEVLYFSLSEKYNVSYNLIIRDSLPDGQQEKKNYTSVHSINFIWSNSLNSLLTQILDFSSPLV